MRNALDGKFMRFGLKFLFLRSEADGKELASAGVVTGVAVAAGRAGDQMEIKALENRRPRRGEDACAYLNA